MSSDNKLQKAKDLHYEQYEPASQECPECEGSGIIMVSFGGAHEADCPECDGLGEIPKENYES